MRDELKIDTGRQGDDARMAPDAEMLIRRLGNTVRCKHGGGRCAFAVGMGKW